MTFLRPLLAKRATTGEKGSKCCGKLHLGRKRGQCPMMFHAAAQIEYRDHSHVSTDEFGAAK